MVSYQVIGRPAPRFEGVEKVTGRARYAADVSLPGTVWGKTLHSPYAHARIVRIDTTAARRGPGAGGCAAGGRSPPPPPTPPPAPARSTTGLQTPPPAPASTGATSSRAS